MLGLVNTWTDDQQQMGKSSRYVTNHAAQLSLAILPG